jgi:hypothetical protein
MPYSTPPGCRAVLLTDCETMVGFHLRSWPLRRSERALLVSGAGECKRILGLRVPEVKVAMTEGRNVLDIIFKGSSQEGFAGTFRRKSTLYVVN